MSLLGRRRDTSLRHGGVAGPGRGAYGGPGVVSVFARARRRGARPVDHGDGLNERDGPARVPGSATGPISEAGDRR